MARPKSLIPTYRLHKRSNTARCWVHGRWVDLGRYNSPESRAEYARIVAELTASPAAGMTTAAGATVNQVLAAFWQHAEQHYRRADGSPTNELSQFRQTFKLVRGLYGHTAARDFGPLALKAIRQAWIDTGWSRKLINQRVGRIRRAFKWAASEQLISVHVYQGLATVTGLQAGRTGARETEPVEPIAEERVRAIFPFLQPALRVMLEVQLLTGMRPGELCQLRPADIDTRGAVWLFRPEQFKTRHRGGSRVVAIGPRAQELLAAFTPNDAEDFYFSPRRVVAEFHAGRTAKRKTPRFPSHLAHNDARRVRQPGSGRKAYYTTTGYGRAIARACEKLHPLPEEIAMLPGEKEGDWFKRLTAEQRAEVRTWRERYHFHPNQIRHTHGTAVRHQFGLEAAQVALGHARADVTQVYAERNLALATTVAAAVG